MILGVLSQRFTFTPVDAAAQVGGWEGRGRGPAGAAQGRLGVGVRMGVRGGAGGWAAGAEWLVPTLGRPTSCAVLCRARPTPL